jgi:ribosome-associated translation inhibitor RaiA
MQINISSPYIPLFFDSLKERIRATLEPLDHHSGDEIRIINVLLSDVNGPKGGGQDKVCRLQARILNHPSVNSEGRHSDLIVAIRQAACRMDRALSSLLDTTRNRNPKSQRGVTMAAYVDNLPVAEEVNA